MTLFLIVGADSVTVMARAESADGTAVGDQCQVVEPGGRFGDLPYATLRRAGDGRHDYDELVRRAAD